LSLSGRSDIIAGKYSGHHGGDIDLSGIQSFIGAPLVLIGALI